MFAIGVTVELAKWIIDDSSCLVPRKWESYKLQLKIGLAGITFVFEEQCNENSHKAHSALTGGHFRQNFFAIFLDKMLKYVYLIQSQELMIIHARNI